MSVGSLKDGVRQGLSQLEPVSPLLKQAENTMIDGVAAIMAVTHDSKSFPDDITDQLIAARQAIEGAQQTVARAIEAARSYVENL